MTDRIDRIEWYDDLGEHCTLTLVKWRNWSREAATPADLRSALAALPDDVRAEVLAPYVAKPPSDAGQENEPGRFLVAEFSKRMVHFAGHALTVAPEVESACIERGRREALDASQGAARRLAEKLEAAEQTAVDLRAEVLAAEKARKLLTSQPQPIPHRGVPMSGGAPMAMATAHYELLGTAIDSSAVTCVRCGNQVEEPRRCYAIPHCYECLPPPPPIPTATLAEMRHPQPSTGERVDRLERALVFVVSRDRVDGYVRGHVKCILRGEGQHDA